MWVEVGTFLREVFAGHSRINAMPLPPTHSIPVCCLLHVCCSGCSERRQLLPIRQPLLVLPWACVLVRGPRRGCVLGLTIYHACSQGCRVGEAHQVPLCPELGRAGCGLYTDGLWMPCVMPHESLTAQPGVLSLCTSPLGTKAKGTGPGCCIGLDRNVDAGTFQPRSAYEALEDRWCWYLPPFMTISMMPRKASQTHPGLPGALRQGQDQVKLGPPS